jgi:hypothetical protein
MPPIFVFVEATLHFYNVAGRRASGGVIDVFVSRVREKRIEK